MEHGPIVLELDTYRYHGHSMSDPGSTYRTRDEVSGIRNERDPIERVRKLLIENELLSVAEMKQVEKDIRKALDEVREVLNIREERIILQRESSEGPHKLSLLPFD